MRARCSDVDADRTCYADLVAAASARIAGGLGGRRACAACALLGGIFFLRFAVGECKLVAHLVIDTGIRTAAACAVFTLFACDARFGRAARRSGRMRTE